MTTLSDVLLVEAGNSLKRAGRFAEAISFYQQAIAVRPDAADTYYNLGTALQALGQFPEAAAAYGRAIDLNPKHAPAFNNLGNLVRNNNQLAEAILCYRRALVITPKNAAILNNLGVALRDNKEPQEAIDCFRSSLELTPDDADVLSNLGNALKDEGLLEEAVACYQKSLSLNPNRAVVLDNLGLAFVDQGNYDEAAACCRRSMELDPDSPHVHWAQSLLMLLKGDFERGWREHEWRWKCQEWRRYTGILMPTEFPQPVWDGSRLEGKTILLQAEQGLGDTIQFIRYVPVVKQFGGRVVLQCQRALIPLLSQCGADTIVGQNDAMPQFDVRAALLTLPAILRTTLETIPADIPYLFAGPALVEQWQERLKDVSGFRVGINWRGRGGLGVFRRRDVPLEYFEPLAVIAGVRLVNLHQGDGRTELAETGPQLAIFEPGSDVDGVNGAFMDTAAIMMNLDLVITSDTAIAHLAGALGVPVWVVLPYAADWRWLLNRSDSPWYPTMRLFRQKQPGDWAEPFAEMIAALTATTNTA
jgi:tetratricopeptide (TPR) repeat protein